MFNFIFRYFASEIALAKKLYSLYSTFGETTLSSKKLIKTAVKKGIKSKRSLLGSLLKDAYDLKKSQDNKSNSQKKAMERLFRKQQKETALENMRNYKRQSREKGKEITKYKNERSRVFKQIGYFNNSSWLTSYNRPNKVTMKGTNKWYSIQGLNDNLIDKMASSVSAGKFLWNTLWLHKRRWTKPKHGKSVRFNKSTLNTFSDVRNKIVSTGKLPKRFTQSIKPIVAKQRYTKTFWNKLNLWK